MKDTGNTHSSVFGLTGGMGSGKSSVAAYLCESFGALHIDADYVCRRLLEIDEEGWCAVRNTFGDEYFLTDQSIDRKKLRRDLFQNQEIRERINCILHPLARTEIARIINENFSDGPSCKVVVEVPLLFEAHWQDDFDAVIVVYADQAHCLERIMRRDQISREEAVAALSTQWPLAEKVLMADYVINNNGSWLDTCLEILHLGRLILRD